MAQTRTLFGCIALCLDWTIRACCTGSVVFLVAASRGVTVFLLQRCDRSTAAGGDSCGIRDSAGGCLVTPAMASAGEALAMQDSVLRLVPDNERPVVHFWYHDKSDWSFVSPPPKKREKPALVGVQRAPIVAGAPKRNSLSDSMEQQWQSEIDAMPPEKRKFFAHFGESKTPTPGSSAAGSPRPSGDWLMELRHTWNAALDDGLHTVPPLDLGEPRQLLPHEISNVSSGLQQQQQPQERKRRRRPKRKRALPVAMHASSLSALAAQATASAASSDAESAGAASIGNGASVAAADDDGSETDTSDDESGPQQNGHSHSNGTSSSTASAASSASAARPPPFDFPPLRGDVVRPHGRMLPMSVSEFCVDLPCTSIRPSLRSCCRVHSDRTSITSKRAPSSATFASRAWY